MSQTASKTSGGMHTTATRHTKSMMLALTAAMPCCSSAAFINRIAWISGHAAIVPTITIQANAIAATVRHVHDPSSLMPSG